MKYQIGYRYRITENGEKLIGEIIDIINNNYIVKWSDETITEESESDIL